MSLEPVTSTLLKQAGARHVFSTRAGGVSEGPYASLNLGGGVGDEPERVEENHRRLAESLGVERQRLLTVFQVHGREVVAVGPGSEQPEVRSRCADALVGQGGVAVGVRTADCVPILLFDRERGAAAAVHAGWRGTVADVVGAAIKALQGSFGVEPGRLVAAIGPSIGPCCFEVGPEVLASFSKTFGKNPWRAKTLPAGKGTVDLFAANEHLLRRAGVSEIEALRLCTACDPARFFSFRRDGERSGRHLSLIVSG